MIQFGAHYQVYKNNKATRFALENFRKHFPDNPIVLISDGGNDFSDMAEEFNCTYHMMENLFAKDSKFRIFEDEDHCAWNGLRLIEWWRRQKLVCEETGQDYVMIMEDDVFIQDSFDIEPPFYLKGIRRVNPFMPAMQEDILKCSGKPDRGYGMCGGSIYNAKTFLSIYDDVVDDIKTNHDRLVKEDRFQWKALGAYDLSLTYHFNKRGYEYEPAHWLGQVSEGNTGLPVVHQWKSLYEYDTHAIINGHIK